MSVKRSAIAALALLGGLTDPARAARDSVTLLYYERPPLHYTAADHKAAGTIVEITERALTDAGISFIWVAKPAKRLLNEVFDGPPNLCSPGWFLNDERREKAIFSKPLMIDRPLIGVVNESSKAKATGEARGTFAAMGTILVREHLTHGSYLEKVLSELPQTHIVQRTSIDVPSMLATVAAHHADLALMTEAEADYYIPQAGPGLSIARFADNVPDARHLICSKQTDPDLIARINAAIK